MPFPFPDWMPWWLQLTLLIAGLLFVFVWLLVPFAVFGVKGRLDALALQIEDLQAELRVLAVPPEDRRPVRPAAPAPVTAAPAVEPVAPPPPARQVEPSATSDAYALRPERAVSPRPTRFDPPPAAAASRAAPPVEPPPAQAPRPVPYASPDTDRPMPWHDRPAVSRDPIFFVPPDPPLPGVPASPRRAPRQEDEWDEHRPRSEPTLRWPPRT